MWVALAGQCRRSYLSAATPIADKRDCGRIVRFGHNLGDKAPGKTCKVSGEHLVA